MAEAACIDSALHGGFRMSVSIPSPARLLPLRALESGDAIFIDAAELLFFPEAGVLFIDGNPHPLPYVRDLYLALVDACATVKTQSPEARTWETSAGFVEVSCRGLNIEINGVTHTPETVDLYTQALRQALEACPDFDDL